MTKHKSPANYRLILFLSVLSKVYKKVIISQTTTFTENKHLLHKYQSGHKRNNSTTTFKNKIQY